VAEGARVAVGRVSVSVGGIGVCAGGMEVDEGECVALGRAVTVGGISVPVAGTGVFFRTSEAGGVLTLLHPAIKTIATAIGIIDFLIPIIFSFLPIWQYSDDAISAIDASAQFFNHLKNDFDHQFWLVVLNKVTAVFNQDMPAVG